VIFLDTRVILWGVGFSWLQPKKKSSTRACNKTWGGGGLGGFLSPWEGEKSKEWREFQERETRWPPGLRLIQICTVSSWATLSCCFFNRASEQECLIKNVS
jgi:hypothetical protein